MVSITGKTVLVTGTNRGIGHALAAEALARGAGRAAAGAPDGQAAVDPRTGRVAAGAGGLPGRAGP
jgi:NAD(P)-dependent dehydrogenase (short-subunit alcohol dehydrogenase family)